MELTFATGLQRTSTITLLPQLVLYSMYLLYMRSQFISYRPGKQDKMEERTVTIYSPKDLWLGDVFNGWTRNGLEFTWIFEISFVFAERNSGVTFSNALHDRKPPQVF